MAYSSEHHDEPEMTSFDETDDSDSVAHREDDDDDDNESAGTDTVAMTARRSTDVISGDTDSWSLNVVAMNFDGAFRSGGGVGPSSGGIRRSPADSETVGLGRAMLRALVLRHRRRHGGAGEDDGRLRDINDESRCDVQDGDGGSGGVDVLFGQQAAFRPTSPDPDRYAVVGDRRAFVVYDRRRYDVVGVIGPDSASSAVSTTSLTPAAAVVEDRLQLPAELRRYLAAMRQTSSGGGVGFVAVLLRRRVPYCGIVEHRRVEESSSARSTVRGCGHACPAGAAAVVAPNHAVGRGVDLVVVSWNGFADEQPVDGRPRRRSNPVGATQSTSSARRRAMLRQAADLADQLAIAFRRPVLVAGTFLLSVDEAVAALKSSRTATRVGAATCSEVAAAEHMDEISSTSAAAAAPAHFCGYVVAGGRPSKRKATTINGHVASSRVDSSSSGVGSGTTSGLRRCFDAGSSFAAATRGVDAAEQCSTRRPGSVVHTVDNRMTSGTGTGFDFRAGRSSPANTAIDVVPHSGWSIDCGISSATTSQRYPRSTPIDSDGGRPSAAAAAAVRVATGSLSPPDSHHLHHHHPIHHPDNRFRCYGYRTDTARRRLRSSQLVLCFTSPSLRVRRVRPLRCGRLRVDSELVVSRQVKSSADGDADRRHPWRQQQPHGRPPAAVDDRAATSSWRDPDDYFYWDALTAVVYVDPDLDGVLTSCVQRLLTFCCGSNNDTVCTSRCINSNGRVLDRPHYNIIMFGAYNKYMLQFRTLFCAVGFRGRNKILVQC